MLIPCDLERASPRDPFRLRAEDDDPVVNPTLRHQLSVLGVDLPALGSDSSEDESIDAYVAAVGDLVGSRGDWSVDAAIALGAFSYSKLAMYQDLERMRRQGVRSDLTQLLAAGGAAHSERATASDAASATPRSEDLAGGRLDDLLDIRDQYAVLPADFSQLGALDQARQGGHLVIHGPPGTGKSQTITSRTTTTCDRTRRSNCGLRTTGGHGHRPGARAKSWVGRSWAGCITSTSVSPRDIRADDIFW